MRKVISDPQSMKESKLLNRETGGLLEAILAKNFTELINTCYLEYVTDIPISV